MKNIDPITLRDEFTQQVLFHDYSKGPLLLLAGPGTGKTYSLLETIKHQIQEGYSISDFFEVTLTNAAADDFLKDAKNQISDDFDSSSTLHFRAKGILHKYASELGIHPDFTVIDDHCIDLIKHDLAIILRIRYSEVSVLLHNYRESSANYSSFKHKFSSIYQGVQSFYNALDWFDVVFFACKLLENNSSILDFESQRFKFLLIDEYQDLNPSDQKLLHLLIKQRNNLLVVGDDDQSIYSIRFADPSGIIDFTTFYPNSKVLHLPVTSRIPTNVISASHQLISLNTGRYDKDKVIPLPECDIRADKGFVISVNNKSDKAEKEFILEALRTLLSHGIPKEQILVLCNCRALGIELIEAIHEMDDGIPIKNDLEKQYDIDINDYLIYQISRFLSNPNGNLPLRLILSRIIEPRQSEISLIIRFSFENNISIWEALHKNELLQQLDESLSVIETLKQAYSLASKFHDPKERSDLFIRELEPFHFLLDFLQEEILNTNHLETINKPNNNQSGVRFITLHSSKGLDADFVFIPFLEESIGLLRSNIEEQRRLLYVALTRAKVGVVMSWAWSRSSGNRFKCSGTGGGVTNRIPSQFISECGINPNLVPPGSAKSSSEVALSILDHHCKVINTS